MSNNSETINKEQLNDLLPILDDIDRVCRRNNIKYTLMYGTLIGAARHKGFIPWDYDADILLDRENFELFKLHASELDPRFRFVTPYTLPNKFFDCINRVVWPEKVIRKEDEITNFYEGLHNCAFVDIFVMDKIKSTGFKYKIQVIRNNILYGMCLSRRYIVSYKKYKKFSQKLQVWLLSKLGKFFKLDKILKKKDKLASKYRNTDSNIGALFDSGPGGGDRFLYDLEDFKEHFDIEFEGRKYMCIKNYDKVLTKYYGDWRTPPKEENRKPLEQEYFI